MKLVSVFGDSISTFNGFNPNGYAVYYDREQQIANGLNSVYDTWWAKVNQALHAFLCVNNSYSGSKVSGGVFPSASCGDRAKMLCNEWGNPDYILVYIGFNDFGNGVAVSSGKKTEHDLRFFEDAYETMLRQIKENCPTSVIVCGTLMRTIIKNRNDWVFPEVYLGIPFEEYNEAIRRACKRQGCYLADLNNNGAHYETLDGTHPTAFGHSVIANEWIKELAKLDLLQPTLEKCIEKYHTNTSGDMEVYLVLQSLLSERILIPRNKDGALVGIQYQNQVTIPIFTSPNELKGEKDISLKAGYMRQSLPELMAARKNLIINPFSEEDKQFVLPYKIIEEMLISLL